ncbi:MAG: c-type cytochrome [Candidatus Methylomirabilales bacterium]
MITDRIALPVIVFAIVVALSSWAAEQRGFAPPLLPQDFPQPPFSQSPFGITKGDSKRGELIYQQNGCTACHSLDGRGKKMGPDLSRVGELHTDPYWFRRYLSDPRSIIPSSIKPPVRLSQPDMDDLIAYLLSLKKFR